MRLDTAGGEFAVGAVVAGAREGATEWSAVGQEVRIHPGHKGVLPGVILGWEKAVLSPVPNCEGPGAPALSLT